MKINIRKRVMGKRQATRLHIEQMKVTREAMVTRAKQHQTDTMAYQTAKAAIRNLDEKIEKAKRELNILETRWKI